MKELNIIFTKSTDSFAIKEWAKKNIELLNKETGLKLTPETVVDFRENLLVKDEESNQTLLVKCDNRISSEYDLGSVIHECSLCEPNGVIWIANQPHSDLIDAFEWMDKITSKDFKMCIINVQVELML